MSLSAKKKSKSKTIKIVTIILLNGEVKFLGYFSSQEEASKVTDKLMLELQNRKNNKVKEVNVEIQSRGLEENKPWVSTTFQTIIDS